MTFVGWLLGQHDSPIPERQPLEDRIGAVNQGVQIVRSAVSLVGLAVEDALDALENGKHEPF